MANALYVLWQTLKGTTSIIAMLLAVYLTMWFGFDAVVWIIGQPEHVYEAQN